MLYFAIVHHNK